MNKHLKASIVGVLMAMASTIVLSAQQSLDPSGYLEASRAAINLPRVIAAYHDYIDLLDPVMTGTFDVDATTLPYSIPSVDGMLGGGFMGIDGFFYIRLLSIDAFSMRALLLFSGFAFGMDVPTGNAYSSLYGYDSTMEWISGNAFFGVQAKNNEDYLTLGAIVRIEPLVDQGPPPRFTRIISGTDDDARTDATFFDRFYIDGSLDGYKLDTLFSISGIEQLAAEKLFGLIGNYFQLGPVFEYLGRLGSFRPGVTASWSPEPWFIASATAKAGIDADSVGLGELRLDLNAPFKLLENISSTGKDMSLSIALRASLLDYGGSLIPGGMAEIALINYPFLTWFDFFGLRYLGYNAIGISWNHSDTLLRLPFRDQPIIYLRLGGSYYFPKN
jgi:hypothetical protein